jgi:hypothetical protein
MNVAADIDFFHHQRAHRTAVTDAFQLALDHPVDDGSSGKAYMRTREMRAAQTS